MKTEPKSNGFKYVEPRRGFCRYIDCQLPNGTQVHIPELPEPAAKKGDELFFQYEYRGKIRVGAFKVNKIVIECGIFDAKRSVYGSDPDGSIVYLTGLNPPLPNYVHQNQVFNELRRVDCLRREIMEETHFNFIDPEKSLRILRKYKAQIGWTKQYKLTIRDLEKFIKRNAAALRKWRLRADD